MLSKDQELELVKLFQPWKFRNEKRVDLHPRFMKDNKNVISLDSGHDGIRRQYLLQKQ